VRSWDASDVWKLLTKYLANRRVWVTQNIFVVYLKALDAKMGAHNENILLFIDHCVARAQNMICLTNVKVVFFP
jgi:hypothetical protein